MKSIKGVIGMDMLLFLLCDDSLLKTIIGVDVEGQVGRGNLQELNSTHIIILLKIEEKINADN